MAKTVLYTATWSEEEEAVVAVMMRGDLDINEVKLVNALDCLAVALADEGTVRRVTGAEIGFAGPLGLPEGTRILADRTLEARTNLLTGCNETGYHCLNVNPDRDLPASEYHDLRLARAGERSPDGTGELRSARGIEVGHIFKLGTKYSGAMRATFIAEDGKPRPFVMGCYGIGVSRTVQAAVEQHLDERGHPVGRSRSPPSRLRWRSSTSRRMTSARRVSAPTPSCSRQASTPASTTGQSVRGPSSGTSSSWASRSSSRRAAASRTACSRWVERSSGEKRELPLEEAVARAAEWVAAQRR